MTAAEHNKTLATLYFLYAAMHGLTLIWPAPAGAGREVGNPGGGGHIGVLVWRFGCNLRRPDADCRHPAGGCRLRLSQTRSVGETAGAGFECCFAGKYTDRHRPRDLHD